MTPCIKQEAHGMHFVTNRLGYEKGRQLLAPTLHMHTHIMTVDWDLMHRQFQVIQRVWCEIPKLAHLKPEDPQAMGAGWKDTISSQSNSLRCSWLISSLCTNKVINKMDKSNGGPHTIKLEEFGIKWWSNSFIFRIMLQHWELIC